MQDTFIPAYQLYMRITLYPKTIYESLTMPKDSLEITRWVGVEFVSIKYKIEEYGYNETLNIFVVFKGISLKKY